MIRQTYSTTTKLVTKEQVWQLMADVDNWKQWDEGVEQSHLQAEFKAGSVFTLKPKGGPNVKVQLLEVQPNSYFKDVTSFPLAKMYDEHSYEATRAGLKITSTLTMTGPLAWLWNKIVMQDIVKNLAKDIQQQIKAAQQL